MSTKENIEYIKNELSNEEKLLESVIKAEKFYKRYKKPLIGIVGLIFVGVLGYIGYDMKQEHDLEVANSAYNKLLKNPYDKEAKKVLKSKNEKLYNLFLYSYGMNRRDEKILKELSKIEDPILSDLATYHVAVIENDGKKLQNYSVNEKAIFSDMAHLDNGYLLMKNGDIVDAKSELSLLSKESVAYSYAIFLKHYGAKVK